MNRLNQSNIQRRLILLVTLFWTISPSLLRGQITASVIDEETKSPVAFANIVLGEGDSDAISDLEGKFSLPDNFQGPLTISCVGYHTEKYHAEEIKQSGTILLTPKATDLNDVDGYSTENNAFRIMEKVVDSIPRNNPDEATNYTCLIYNKMTFNLQVPDSVSPSDTTAKKIINFNRSQHLMLMESVLEKKHMMPDKNKERIISERVTGLQDPALSILSSQLRPFTFYSRYFKLMDARYLNPVSKRGLKSYYFSLDDTIKEDDKHLYYITFRSRDSANINPMTGSFHIVPDNYAIKKLKANTKIPGTSFELQIHQTYQLIDDKQWFPAEQESRLISKSTGANDTLPYPLEGKAKSLVTAVDISPEIDSGEFSAGGREDDMRTGDPEPESVRYQPLTAQDSVTYFKLDSLSQEQKFNKFFSLPKKLVKGYLSEGALRLDLKHLIGYNKFEGWKLGLGLWTGEKLTGDFSVGGYFKHAFRIEDNHYGTAVKWQPSSASSSLSASYSHDMQTTGNFSFYRTKGLSTEDLLKSLAASIKDKTTRTRVSAKTKLLKKVWAQLFFTYADVEPLRTYGFDPEATTPIDAFSNREFGIKLRWSHKEQMEKAAFGLFTEPPKGPTFWLNVISGKEYTGEGESEYTKAETQVEKTFLTGSSAQTSLRLTGAIINGKPAASNLYSFFGSYDAFGIEVPYTFATMGPNEFAADRFAMAYLNHRIPLRQNSPSSFKPEIVFMSKAGWGDLSSSSYETLKTFNQGFYESGVKIDNLMSMLFIKYGIAVHYRYGPYQNEENINNWSFRLSLDLAF
ncbi:MAG: DUF5686 family protein [Marinilabilia sp.]